MTKWEELRSIFDKDIVEKKLKLKIRLTLIKMGIKARKFENLYPLPIIPNFR